MNYLQKSLALLDSGLLMFVAPGGGLASAREAQPSSQSTPASTKQSAEELQQLVAPIALYPDALVSQILASTTYPTEIVDRPLDARAFQSEE